MPEIVTFTQHGRIAILTLNNPPVNALSHALRVALCERLADAQAAPAIEAIVLHCEGRTFVAGADIREFGKVPQAPDVPELVEFVGGGSKPVIAAMHGTTLGGGLELALACHFRLAAATTRLGFPEVSLGILPGAGGTQRLPRLVGVRAALEMIVGGAPVGATRAQELGLVDAIIDGDLKAGALTFAESVVDRRSPPRKASALRAELEEPNLLADFEAGIRERYRGQLAPFHCIRAIRGAVELPFAEGLKLERELFAELMRSPQARAQRHVFFAEREVAKVPGLPQDTPARPLRNVAVIGAGARGSELAICFADAHLPVKLLDTSAENLEQGLGSVRQHYANAVAAGRLDATEGEIRSSYVRPALAYEAVSDANLVVEAVPEQLELKRRVFAELDAVCKPGAILATTTSSLDVNELARATQRPEAVIGLHFPRPARDRRLVEVARTQKTAPDVWASALGVGRVLGKVAVSVVAHPGFVGQRMAGRALREALSLVEDGALPEQVDRVCFDFGFPFGPFARADEELQELVRARAKSRGDSRRTLTDEEILERYLYAMINEGARILDDGVTARALDIDMVWIHGYGFPTHRGGPMFYADELGLARVHRSLLDFQRRLDAASWKPSPLLEQLANDGRGFYAAR